MNYFTKIPDELILEIFSFHNYLNLIKMPLLNNFLTNQYTSEEEYLHKNLITNKGFTIIENNSSFNLQKPIYTISITKNATRNYRKLTKYLHNL